MDDWLCRIDSPNSKQFRELLDSKKRAVVAGPDTIAGDARDRFKDAIAWRDGLDPPSPSVPNPVGLDPMEGGTSPLDSPGQECKGIQTESSWPQNDAELESTRIRYR